MARRTVAVVTLMGRLAELYHQFSERLAGLEDMEMDINHESAMHNAAAILPAMSKFYRTEASDLAFALYSVVSFTPQQITSMLEKFVVNNVEPGFQFMMSGAVFAGNSQQIISNLKLQNDTKAKNTMANALKILAIYEAVNTHRATIKLDPTTQPVGDLYADLEDAERSERDESDDE